MVWGGGVGGRGYRDIECTTRQEGGGKRKGGETNGDTKKAKTYG